MTILQRYVMGRIASTLATTVVGVLLVVWIVQALQRVDLVTDGGTAISSFFWIALLLLPRMLTVVLPFALVLSVMTALNGMNSDSETVVAHASGAGRRVFVVPVLATAAIVTVVFLFTVHVLEPSSRQAFRSAVSEARAALLSSLLRDGQFLELGDGLTVNIERRTGGGELVGMLLSDRRDADAERTYYARTAVIAEREGVEFVLMRNGQFHSRSSSDGTIQIIEYSTYALDLSNLSAQEDDTPTLRAKDRSTIDLLYPNPDDGEFQRNPGDFRAELHKRLSSWLYIWAFCVVALHAAARPLSTRETNASAMLYVLGICLVARGLGFVLEDAAADNPMLIPLLYIVPLTVIVIYSAAMWRDRRFILPPVFRRARNRIWDGVSARLVRLRAQAGRAS